MNYAYCREGRHAVMRGATIATVCCGISRRVCVARPDINCLFFAFAPRVRRCNVVPALVERAHGGAHFDTLCSVHCGCII